MLSAGSSRSSLTISLLDRADGSLRGRLGYAVTDQLLLYGTAGGAAKHVRINDGVGAFIAQRLVRFLSRNATPLSDARVAILGLTFKENVSDTRNSRVPDIARELENFGVKATVSDPKARAEDAMHEYGIALTDLAQAKNLDALVLAVPHREYLAASAKLFERLKPQGVLIDVKSVIDPATVPKGMTYWSL